jgi:predicted dehydrogenase
MRATYSVADNRPVMAPEGRVAVVGAGGFGQFVLDAYRQAPGIAVVAIADPKLAGRVLQSHPDLPIEPDWRTLLADPAVEIIHLATPPFLRGAIVLPALRAGKGVLCEKPLALSLEEADEMIAVSAATGSALGTNYVLRHHPAFAALTLLGSSGLFGPPYTFSLQNFAQALPDDHWMWDQARSGGILVEHGVHFFDAYGQIAGRPERVWGTAPRPEAVQVSVQYAGGALGSYYHEFAFPHAVEHTLGIVIFRRGFVKIEGWIPERLDGKVMAPAEALRQAIGPLQLPFDLWEEGEVTRFAVEFTDRREAYQAAITRGMRELIACQRDAGAALTVSLQNARESLALALAARRATETGVSQATRGE